MTVVRDEVRDATAVLFPELTTEADNSAGPLTLDVLKNAYRKRALATHPDGSGPEAGHEAFVEVKAAYDRLQSFLSSRDRATGAPWGAPASRWDTAAGTGGSGASSFRYHEGPLPKTWVLAFEQYLYYSKLIPWQTLMQAIAWRRANERLFCDMALDLGLVTEEDVRRARSQRRPDEAPHQTAVRLQILRTEQVGTVLRAQRGT
ncbi:MAG: DnaJ domain-containing protein, partial [Armatimonadia bacterium]|nr:DnaJ domain-containing protein [Armatimonadia bacterium]